MTALTAAQRQRNKRARDRAARSDAWCAEYPATWHPFLRSWAARGLRLPPTTAQLQLLQPYAERSRGPNLVGSTLARVRRAGARHSPTTYRLVAALVRALDHIARLAQDAQDAFDRPLGLDDPNAKRERGEGEPGAQRAPVRRSVRGSPGQLAHGSFRERMIRAGMSPELADRLGGRKGQDDDRD